MTSALVFCERTFPSRIANLGFRARLPQDWIAHEPPEEDADFNNPTTMVPLAIVTAPHAAIVLAFAARPAYDDGTLDDWAWYLLNHSQLKPQALGRALVANVRAVVGEAMQESDMGSLVVRFAFLEDGDRLINLSFTAPEVFADAVRDAWFELLRSFQLESPQGSRFKTDAHPDDVPAEPIPEPWLNKAPAADDQCQRHTDADDSNESTANGSEGTEPDDDTRSESSVASAAEEPPPAEETLDGQEARNAEEPRPSSGTPPAWWFEALALEADNNLEAAEQHIARNCPYIGYAYATADMYRLRMLRLKAVGDDRGALDAFKKSSRFIFHYASLATSGGEGAALSDERDHFRERLVAEYGSDPEARA